MVRNGNQRFLVRVRLLAICRSERFAGIAQLLSKCLWSRRNWYWGIKEMPSPLPLHSCDSWILVKENQDTKKKKEKNWDHRPHQRFMVYYIRAIFNIELFFFSKFTCEEAKVYNPRQSIWQNVKKFRRLEQIIDYISHSYMTFLVFLNFLKT